MLYIIVSFYQIRTMLAAFQVHHLVYPLNGIPATFAVDHELKSDNIIVSLKYTRLFSVLHRNSISILDSKMMIRAQSQEQDALSLHFPIGNNNANSLTGIFTASDPQV